MVFNSLVFLGFFLAVFALYWGFLVRHIHVRNVFLLACSYAFYGYWDWRFLFLIAFSSLVDFQVGKSMGTSQNEKNRKVLLCISLFTNLGLLGLFKYYNFFLDNFIDAFSLFGQRSKQIV